MMQQFEVHSDKEVVAVASRSVRSHSGWQSVRYAGKRYQLFGGIRTPWFITLGHHIKKPG